MMTRTPNAAGGTRNDAPIAVSLSPADATDREAVRPDAGASAVEKPAVEEMLGYLLRRANSMYHQYWADNFALADGTLTPMQAGMLLAIHQWGPITQTELAQRLKIKLPSALHSTNHLEAQHYVTRSARPDDRRSYTLGLTSAGEAALRAVSAMAPVRDDALLAPLSAAEREQLRNLLMRVVAREG